KLKAQFGTKSGPKPGARAEAVRTKQRQVSSLKNNDEPLPNPFPTHSPFMFKRSLLETQAKLLAQANAVDIGLFSGLHDEKDQKRGNQGSQLLLSDAWNTAAMQTNAALDQKTRGLQIGEFRPGSEAHGYNAMMDLQSRMRAQTVAEGANRSQSGVR